MAIDSALTAGNIREAVEASRNPEPQGLSPFLTGEERESPPSSIQSTIQRVVNAQMSEIGSLPDPQVYPEQTQVHESSRIEMLQQATRQAQYTGTSMVSGATISPYYNWAINEVEKTFPDKNRLWTAWQSKFIPIKGKTRKSTPLDKLKFNLFYASINEETERKSLIEQSKARLLENKKLIRDKEKETKTIEKHLTNIEKESEEYQKTTEQERMEKSLTLFEKIATLEHVVEVQPDDESFFIIKTSPLFVKKESWTEQRLIGSFLIKIPFNLDNNDLRILNITQRMDSYDHPCILETRPCLGNVRKDLEIDKKNGNILEFINDVIAYIQSPNEKFGYVKKPKVTGNDTQGWEWFLEKAKKMPENYDFKKFEKRTKDSLGEPSRSGILSQSGTFLDSSFNAAQPTSHEWNYVIGSLGTEGETTPATFIPSQAPIRRDDPAMVISSPNFKPRLQAYIRSRLEIEDFNIAEHIMRIFFRTMEHALFLSKIEFRGNEIIEWVGINSEGNEAGSSTSIPQNFNISPVHETIYFEIPRWYER